MSQLTTRKAIAELEKAGRILDAITKHILRHPGCTCSYQILEASGQLNKNKKKQPQHEREEV
jgi:hypothetical protein